MPALSERMLPSAARQHRESKWSRAESNRRPKVSQRPLSYARSRRSISPRGLPSTGFRRTYRHDLFTFTPSRSGVSAYPTR